MRLSCILELNLPLPLMQLGKAERLALIDSFLASVEQNNKRYIESPILFLLHIMIYHWKELE